MVGIWIGMEMGMVSGDGGDGDEDRVGMVVGFVGISVGGDRMVLIGWDGNRDGMGMGWLMVGIKM